MEDKENAEDRTTKSSPLETRSEKSSSSTRSRKSSASMAAAKARAKAEVVQARTTFVQREAVSTIGKGQTGSRTALTAA